MGKSIIGQAALAMASSRQGELPPVSRRLCYLDPAPFGLEGSRLSVDAAWRAKRPRTRRARARRGLVGSCRGLYLCG